MIGRRVAGWLLLSLALAFPAHAACDPPQSEDVADAGGATGFFEDWRLDGCFSEGNCNSQTTCYAQLRIKGVVASAELCGVEAE